MNREHHARVWFYYANGHQVGPIPLRNIREALIDGSLTQSDYVYREGFRDWKLIKDVPEIQVSIPSDGLTRVSKAIPENSPTIRAKEKRVQTRAAIHELVVAHNDSSVATGSIIDISANGMFLQTDAECFSLNEEIKVTLKDGKGLGKPMHLRAVIVRQSRDPISGPGYGLEIRSIDEKTRVRILDYVRRNQAS